METSQLRWWHSSDFLWSGMVCRLSQIHILSDTSVGQPVPDQSDVLFIGMKLTAQCEPCTGLQDKIKWKTFLCHIYMNKNILRWHTGNDGSYCWIQRGVHVVTEVALIFFFFPISFSYVYFKYRIPSYIYIYVYFSTWMFFDPPKTPPSTVSDKLPPSHAISTPWL